MSGRWDGRLLHVVWWLLLVLVRWWWLLSWIDVSGGHDARRWLVQSEGSGIHSGCERLTKRTEGAAPSIKSGP